MCIIETVIAGMLDINSLVANISLPTEYFFVLTVDGVMPFIKSSIQYLANTYSSFMIHLILLRTGNRNKPLFSGKADKREAKAPSRIHKPSSAFI